MSDKHFSKYASAEKIRWLCSALMLAAVMALPVTALAQANALTPYEQARALFKEGKDSETIAFLDKHLLANPRDARSLVLRGDAKAVLGNDLEALKDYNTAIGIDPNYQYAYVTRCDTRYYVGDMTGALADCDTAVKLDPSDALAYENRADVQFEREAYSLALSDYDKAVSLGRSSAYLFAARCDTERLVKRNDLAKPDCQKALILDPKSRRALWANGRLDIEEGRYDDGAAHLAAYIASNPEGSTGAYYYRAFANNRSKNYGPALADIRVYVQRDPGDADGYRERGLALHGTGDKQAALNDLAEAQLRYVRNGNQTEAAHVGTMIDAITAGRAPIISY